MRERIEKLYQFDELSDSAKDRARDWYRQGIGEDTDWAEYVIDSAVQAGQMLGVRFATRGVWLMNGSIRQEPKMYWEIGNGSDVWFDATYSYAVGSARKVRAEWPQDAALHRIATGLRRAQQTAFYQLSADISCNHRGRHINVRVERTDGTDATDRQIEQVTNCLTDFAGWILDSLNREWEWMHSDECIDENIRANEYEFLENGKRA